MATTLDWHWHRWPEPDFYAHLRWEDGSGGALISVFKWHKGVVVEWDLMRSERELAAYHEQPPSAAKEKALPTP